MLLLLCPLLPESPHWLLVAGDWEGAEALLRRMAAAQGVKLPAGKLENSPAGTSAADAGDAAPAPEAVFWNCGADQSFTMVWRRGKFAAL